MEMHRRCAMPLRPKAMKLGPKAMTLGPKGPRPWFCELDPRSQRLRNRQQ